MIKREHTFVVLLVLLLLSACSAEESSGCRRRYPQGFSVSDLIGTWDGMVETAWDSTIIVREDGQYKQIMHIKRTGFKYESDWLPWRVTYSEDGLPYLHLEGMMICGAYFDLVECTEETAKEVNGAKWYDYCHRKWVETPGEGVFRVFKTGHAPRGISLVPFTRLPDGTSGPSYELREP